MKKILNVLFVLVLVLSFSLVTAAASFVMITALPATPAIATTSSGTYYVATTGDDTSGDGSLGTPWKSITHAISIAASGSTINVETGTYNGTTGETFPITINNPIILKSMNGSGNTTIGPPPAVDDPNITDGMTIKVTASDVTIGGSGAGFTIITRVSAGIWAPSTTTTNPSCSATGLQILYNKFQAVTQGESRGIWIEAPFQADTTHNAIIDHNDFSQATGFNGVLSGGWTGVGQGAPGTGIEIVQAALGASTRALITNNTAANQKYSFLTFKNERKNVASDGVGDESKAVASMTVEGVDVYGNVVNNNAEAMEFARKGSGTESLTIGSNLVKVYNNKFYSNGEGIRIVAASGSSTVNGVDKIQIEYNDIYSNTKTCAWWQRNGYGVENGQSTTVDALYNFWGDGSGPTISGNDRGDGDKISASNLVDYEPWLHTTEATAYGSGVRYFAYNWCSLSQGWNFWSTPIALDAQCSTWGTYRTLGTDLALVPNVSNAYYFNGATQSWINVTDSYSLTPCDAICIDMASAQTSPILFSPLLSVPSKTLVAGWNLVSASYINDLNSPDIDNGINPEDALASIYYVTGANNIGYSQVVSPAAGQPAWSGVRGLTISSSVGGRNDMLPCKGYMVYMTNAGTLAGMVFTPVSTVIRTR